MSSLSSQARIWVRMNYGVLCDGAGPSLELRLQGQASAVLSASDLFLALHPKRCKEMGGREGWLRPQCQRASWSKLKCIPCSLICLLIVFPSVSHLPPTWLLYISIHRGSLMTPQACVLEGQSLAHWVGGFLLSLH